MKELKCCSCENNPLITINIKTKTSQIPRELYLLICLPFQHLVILLVHTELYGHTDFVYPEQESILHTGRQLTGGIEGSKPSDSLYYFLHRHYLSNVGQHQGFDQGNVCTLYREKSSVMKYQMQKLIYTCTWWGIKIIIFTNFETTQNYRFYPSINIEQKKLNKSF